MLDGKDKLGFSVSSRRFTIVAFSQKIFVSLSIQARNWRCSKCTCGKSEALVVNTVKHLYYG